LIIVASAGSGVRRVTTRASKRSRSWKKFSMRSRSSCHRKKLKRSPSLTFNCERRAFSSAPAPEIWTRMTVSRGRCTGRLKFAGRPNARSCLKSYTRSPLSWLTTRRTRFDFGL
jgi:hypothetical protein